jgi:hypothetical protein
MTAEITYKNKSLNNNNKKQRPKRQKAKETSTSSGKDLTHAYTLRGARPTRHAHKLHTAMPPCAASLPHVGNK